jgi:lipoate-protein ligase A
MIVTFDGGLTAAENLRRDEAFLRQGVAEARVAILSDRTVSLGVGESLDDPTARAARTEGLPMVRRSSGGTGLLHLPGDLVWSVVLPRNDARVGLGFVRSYARLGAPVVEFVRSLGPTAAWTGPIGRSERHCLLGARGEVLTVSGRALGGAAQHVTGTNLLHHGVVNVDLDRPALRRLFGLDEATADQVTSLRDLGVREPPTELGRRLRDALERL